MRTRLVELEQTNRQAGLRADIAERQLRESQGAMETCRKQLEEVKMNDQDRC